MTDAACSSCQGKGYSIGFGQIAYPCRACAPKCPDCNGRGRITIDRNFEDPCKRCEQRGVVWPKKGTSENGVEKP